MAHCLYFQAAFVPLDGRGSLVVSWVQLDWSSSLREEGTLAQLVSSHPGFIFGGRRGTGGTLPSLGRGVMEQRWLSLRGSPEPRGEFGPCRARVPSFPHFPSARWQSQFLCRRSPWPHHQLKPLLGFQERMAA